MNLKDENTTFKPLRVLRHSKINAYFSKNSEDFVVREKPLYEFSGEGEHLIIQICKKDLSTNEALRILSEFSGAKMRDFGYAGLKDKQGCTFQHISLPKKFEAKLSHFSHPKMKIMQSFIHNNKLRIGHLKGNSFFIRLKKVIASDALKLEQALENLNKMGFANYFGYQRFGKFKDNYKEGLAILQGKKMKNVKMKDFLISAFQSELFNRYLSKRVEISHFSKEFSVNELGEIYHISKEEAKSLKTQKQFFKLLKNEVLGHYPFGKCFLCENLENELVRFMARDISAMGLLMGVRAFECGEGFAKNLEQELFKEGLEFRDQMQGSRRFMWGYLKDLKYHYDAQKAHFSFEFFLEKGSYATVILDELLQNEGLES
ncbi:tRNA pseudouridine(13) synthase TruD [Campylobacter upsaliensis]